METDSSRLQPGTPEYEELKSVLMAGIDMKLSQTEESMWRRGLKEIRRLQTEQNEFTKVVTDLQDKQEALITENQKLRVALCEVTSKFEKVVTEVRTALHQMQHGAGHGRPSPSPSVASTAASDAASPCLGGLVLHSPELAQGRVHVGHLERALQRYANFPETFEDAWQRLGSIHEKASLVSEINHIVENKLEMRRKVCDEGMECRTLLLQYEDALLKLKKATLALLESQNAKRMNQDESFTEPTPSSHGNVSMNLGLTPSWPTCVGGDSSAESFLTPPRASVTLQDQALLGESGWASWYLSPAFADARPSVPPPAVLSLASALTETPTYSSPPPTAPSCSGTAPACGGLKQLQLAECLDEPRVSGVSSVTVLPAIGPNVAGLPLVPGTPTCSQSSTANCWQEHTLQYATPPLGFLTVELQKEPDFTTLGMEVNESDGAALHVQRIDDDGLVGHYNATQSSDATMLRVGDVIWEVNGVRGDSESMLQECKVQQRLVLAVARSKDRGVSPEASSLPSPGAVPGSTGLLDTPGGLQGGQTDNGELDRVLAEVAAPPASWGRLRPEARVFVPSNATQVSDEKSSVETHDDQASKVEAVTDENIRPSIPTCKADALVESGSLDEDKVARLLFP